MITLLCGFMGSGKSFLLRQMGGGLDLDDYVLQKEKLSSIRDFMNQHGERAWRQIERQALGELLCSLSSGGKDAVVALGGGALDETTLRWAQAPGVRLLWVRADFETCWERIRDCPSRPLVALGKRACRELFLKRERFYREAHWWI